MSLFFAHYNCHEGALVMHKDNGAIYRVHGNVSLWDMTAVLELWDVDNDRPVLDDGGGKIYSCAKSKEFADRFLILDPGNDRLSEALKIGLSQIAGGKLPVK